MQPSDLPVGTAGIEPEVEVERLRLAPLLEAQRAACAANPYPSQAERDDRLARLESIVRDHADKLAAAISADFGNRSRHETQLLEVFPSLEAIKHARRHLGAWMKPRTRAVSMWFLPGRAEVVYQPLGVAGIIVPWNYPVLLAVGPLVAALAAGNRAMMKLSEFTPRTNRLFGRLIARHFAKDEVLVIGGNAEVGKAFARLPFDHLLFTGSTSVGRLVMKEAAENLTPVTLELGGKSPAIVGPDYPVDRAAERILAGKCLNAGQTCIAPDYALVPEGEIDAFVAAARTYVTSAYPNLMRSRDYTSMGTIRQFHRMVDYLDEARAKGARIVPLSPAGEAANRTSRRVAPVLLLDAPESLHAMRHEIFGPILPVVAYRTLDEAIAYVNARPRPLALYYFDLDESRVQRVLTETVAGGVTINDTLLHIAQEELPFGGVGPSGMGQYHGRAGFLAFSKEKPVFRQARWNAMGLLSPPYGKLFEQLVAVLMR